jgi:hypothetical protein
MELTNYYEFNNIYSKPLIQNQVIEAKGKHFRVDRYFNRENHCYVFIDVSEEQVKPFAKKPSEVKELIKNGIIKVI